MSESYTDNKQEILMSPLLSKRLDKMENKLEDLTNLSKQIITKFNQISDILDNNSERWDKNKQEYIDLLKENKTMSEHNIDFLNKNRELYLKKLDNLKKENSNIINNIYNTDIDTRRNNMYWRTSGTNTVMKPPSTIGEILWPWNNPWKK